MNAFILEAPVRARYVRLIHGGAGPSFHVKDLDDLDSGIGWSASF